MSYYTLVASLPHLPRTFDVEYPPISRRSLQARLAMLRDDDAATVRQLQDFLEWDRQPADRTDEEVVDEYRRIKAGVRNELVIRLIDHRLGVRTIVSALRRRRMGLGPPVGVGPLATIIRKRFDQPQFGLERTQPWIEGFQSCLLTGDAVGGERLLFEQTWQHWWRLAAGYTFSFEAVLLYLARWTILERWTTRDAETGRRRFETLMQEMLGERNPFPR